MVDSIGDGVPLIRAATLVRPGIVHGFTTRAGGVSRGDLASLNLGARPGEDPAALQENWSRVTRALAPGLRSEQIALMSQVHGAAVARVHSGTGPHATVGEVDAAFTTAPGVLLAVRVADCVPVLIAAPGGVAVAHAGWRSLVAGIVPTVVLALADATGDPPEAMAAAIGPHIGPEAFEVGEEVVEAIRAAGLDPRRCVRQGPRRPHVDLGAAVLQQLSEVGVGRSEHLGLCTHSDHRFFSHRRDGPGTGRLAGVIARLEPS